MTRRMDSLRFSSTPTLHLTLLAISAVAGSLLFVALVSKKENRTANWLLAAFVVKAVSSQALETMHLAREELSPFLEFIEMPLLLLGPLMAYFYVYTLTRGRGLLRHFGVHLAFLSVGLTGAFFLRPPQWHSWVRNVLLPIVWAMYLTACYFEVYSFRKQSANFHSDPSIVKFRWMRFLLGLFTFLWIVTVLNLLFRRMPLIEFHPFAVSAAVFSFACYALRLSPIFVPAEKEDSPKKNQTPRISDEQLAQWSTKLRHHVETSRAYLNPEIRLPELAQAVGLKGYQLSEVLNRGLGVTFFQFINQYRIEEAKRRLKDPKEYRNILGIALDSGFSSKSSFNETFRQLVGMTPSQFRGSGENSLRPN